MNHKKTYQFEKISLGKIDRDFDLLHLNRLDPKRYPYLLESVAGGTANSRFSILFSFPQNIHILDSKGKIDGKKEDFLEVVNQLWMKEREESDERDDLPFTGGWFVYLGYELVGQIESGLNLPTSKNQLPVAFISRVASAMIIDHLKNDLILLSENSCKENINLMKRDLSVACKKFAGKDNTTKSFLRGQLIEDDESIYLRSVKKCIDYIFQGDVFQVNLSKSWHGKLISNIDHSEVYSQLRRCNPSPFAGFMCFGNKSVVSSSPERLIESRRGVLQTRPIAGTRPRGASGITDIALSNELIAHPKERAEHIMLLDLERNDMSRVCEAGTVKVSEMMIVESYTHVHHIVSNVIGVLKKNIYPGDIIRAVFPGGTITGCPKVRCMEILAELEKVGRGAYTGSMGYIGRNGDLDLNILIRTLVCEGDQVTLRSGGGIVADSIPKKELEETRNKARGLIRSLDGSF